MPGVGGPGGDGAVGGNASGGGIYVTSGSISVEQESGVTSNIAEAGDGGAGGAGGKCFLSARLAVNDAQAGNANGGGVYLASGNVLVTENSIVNNDAAQAGNGGNGGAGGLVARVMGWVKMAAVVEMRGVHPGVAFTY